MIRRAAPKFGLVIVAAVLASSTAAAVVAADDAATSPPSSSPPDAFPHPVLPEPSSRWPSYAFRVVGALFVLAAVIGPIVRKRYPQDLPPTTHSHDEPPGSSGHHGRSGTTDLNPPDHSRH